MDPVRAAAYRSIAAHYQDVFLKGVVDYAIPAQTVSTEERLRQLSAFFSWSAWATVTNRPGLTVSYTQNWPHEPLVGNVPTGESVVWTGVSIIMLLAGISAMGWWYASRRRRRRGHGSPRRRPLQSWEATPSQRATVKYFLDRSSIDSCPDGAGDCHGSLWCRRGRFLRHPAFEMVALQCRSHVAYSNRTFLDCDGVAGRRIVYWSAREQS